MQKHKFDFKDKTLIALFSALIFFLAVTVISQICLKNSSTREIFTGIEKYENISYTANSNLPEGYITVKLTSGKPSEKIELWFNGEKAENITKRKLRFRIDCGGVVEIKNCSGKKISAEVDGVSDNIELMMSNKPELLDGIKVLCSVSLKD